MITAIYTCNSTDRHEKQYKTLLEALSDLYLDNYVYSAVFFKKMNLCHHFETCKIAELFCADSLLHIKDIAEEKEVKDCYKFAVNMVGMNCRINIEHQYYYSRH